MSTCRREQLYSALQSPTTQAARILASSLSRVVQGDTLQVPRARRGVQPAHPKRGATGSSRGGAALSSSSAREKARRGLCIPVCAAEQQPALPPSGIGGHREASRARRLGGCQVPGRRAPGIRWVGTHCWQRYSFLQPCTLRKPLSMQVCLLHSNQTRSWLPHPAAGAPLHPAQAFLSSTTRSSRGKTGSANSFIHLSLGFP